MAPDAKIPDRFCWCLSGPSQFHDMSDVWLVLLLVVVWTTGADGQRQVGGHWCVCMRREVEGAVSQSVQWCLQNCMHWGRWARKAWEGMGSQVCQVLQNHEKEFRSQKSEFRGGVGPPPQLMQSNSQIHHSIRQTGWPPPLQAARTVIDGVIILDASANSGFLLSKPLPDPLSGRASISTRLALLSPDHLIHPSIWAVCFARTVSG